ncbi:MAG: DUF4304 domain-containing protein [Actinobacteria bacterium]|nr:DUF4304 domain-containing protein [Actinomycetota bacterium]
MTARNVVQEALERFGRQAGLEKKSGAWYRGGDEVIAVVDLQKSQYGPQYYLNLGFWLRELEGERYPKGSECHILLRLETLVPQERHRIVHLLDMEEDVPDEQRIEELVALLTDRVLPVIERAGTVAGLRALVDDGTLASAAIRGPAQRVLSSAT